MSNLKVFTFGQKGVNVDKNPIELGDDELRRSANAISDPLGNESGLRKRPGLAAQNTSTATGVVMGGIGVPLLNTSASGIRRIFLGRGRDL